MNLKKVKGNHKNVAANSDILFAEIALFTAQCRCWPVAEAIAWALWRGRSADRGISAGSFNRCPASGWMVFPFDFLQYHRRDAYKASGGIDSVASRAIRNIRG
jgi:hypothetical protein